MSRKTGYKWFERYGEVGVAGLVDRSRAPRQHPQAMTDEIAECCVAVRRAHPSWGPAKVRAWLERRAPRTQWPAASSIGTLFDREGLTIKRRLRRRSSPSSTPFAHCGAANDVWCIDFKGWFRTDDGARCEPLTLSDAHSRYLLRCQALARTDADHVWPVLEAAFREFGLPQRLRNGEIRWQGNTIYITAALIGEPVGLAENADGGWTVCIILGVIAHRGDRLRKPEHQAYGLVDNAARCPQSPQSQQLQKLLST